MAHLIRAVGDKHQDGHRAQAAGQEIEQLQGGWVSPMRILDDEEEASGHGRNTEHGPDRFVETQAGVSRFSDRASGRGPQVREQPA